MKVEGEGQLLRIIIGESDRWEGMPLREAIVRKAREEGLTGAMVIRGLEGFGEHSRIHTTGIPRLSQDLPILIEIVDMPDRIQKILPALDRMVAEGMMTMEKVRVVACRHGDQDGPGATVR